MLKSPNLPLRLKARCGELKVPESRTEGQKTISLRIAVIRATSKKREPDPIFFITGGPGQAATESFVTVHSSFARLKERDIVLVDQRGTGGSNALACKIPQALRNTPDPTPEQMETWTKDCLQSLNADVRRYTTSAAIDDLEAARKALGYAAINLYGVSYGTRVALSYLAKYETNVRTVVLDGVIPQDGALGANVAKDAQRALDAQLRRCAETPHCDRRFPKLREKLKALFDRLEKEPQKVVLPHPVTNKRTEVVFSQDRLSTTLRLFIYQPETAALLPLLIHHASTEDDLRLLAAQGAMIEDQLEGGISNAMNHAVLCAEDVPFFPPEVPTSTGALFSHNKEREALLKTCALWPRAKIPEGFKAPVRSAKPVLLLSGEHDPVTPPSGAAQAAQTLSNSLHLVAPGQGHMVVNRGCITRIMRTFIKKASVAGLKTDCVKAMSAPPFFVDFAGPLP